MHVVLMVSNGTNLETSKVWGLYSAKYAISCNLILHNNPTGKQARKQIINPRNANTAHK
jgi:hypothetical protein